MNLFYDIDTKSFSSEISSNNSSIKNKKIIFDKGLVEFKNSISLFLIDELLEEISLEKDFVSRS